MPRILGNLKRKATAEANQADEAKKAKIYSDDASICSDKTLEDIEEVDAEEVFTETDDDDIKSIDESQYQILPAKKRRFHRSFCKVCQKDYPTPFKWRHDGSRAHKNNVRLAKASSEPILENSVTRIVQKSRKHTGNKWTQYLCEPCNKNIAISYRAHHEKSSSHIAMASSFNSSPENVGIHQALMDACNIEYEGKVATKSPKYSDEDIELLINKNRQMEERLEKYEKTIEELKETEKVFQKYINSLNKIITGF